MRVSLRELRLIVRNNLSEDMFSANLNSLAPASHREKLKSGEKAWTMAMSDHLNDDIEIEPEDCYGPVPPTSSAADAYSVTTDPYAVDVNH